MLMYEAILLLLAMFGIVFGFFIYRILIRSKSFARLIGGAVEVPPETPNEVINRFRAEKSKARNCVGKCRTAATKANRAARDINRELRSP